MGILSKIGFRRPLKYVDSLAVGGLPKFGGTLKFEPEKRSPKAVMEALHYLAMREDNFVLISMELPEDCHLCGQSVENGAEVCTDGEFLWTGMALHYFQFHGMPLPEELWKKMERKKFHLSKLSEREVGKVIDKFIKVLGMKTK